MKADELLETWEDGHALLRDRRQWIVKHPPTCRNAKRGNLLSQYAKWTYFTQEANLRNELGQCGLRQAGHPRLEGADSTHTQKA